MSAIALGLRGNAAAWQSPYIHVVRNIFVSTLFWQAVANVPQVNAGPLLGWSAYMLVKAVSWGALAGAAGGLVASSGGLLAGAAGGATAAAVGLGAGGGALSGVAVGAVGGAVAATPGVAIIVGKAAAVAIASGLPLAGSIEALALAVGGFCLTLPTP